LATSFAQNGTITMTGNIATTILPYGQASSAGPTFNNVTVTIPTTNAALFNQTIYGQSDPGGGATYTGAGWTAFQTYLNTIATSYMTASGVYNTVQATMIGEISSGMLGGFVNSATPSSQYGGMDVGSLPSYEWWTLSPQPVFSQLQPDNPYYNQYSSIIYDASDNGAYSIPYSDRFGSGPLINSVQAPDGTSVGSWDITLGAPIPEPGSWGLFGAVSALFLVRFLLNYRRKA